MSMLDDIKEMSKGLYKGMMKDMKDNVKKQKLSTANFCIREKIEGKVQITVSGHNPDLVLKAWPVFRKKALEVCK